MPALSAPFRRRWTLVLAIVLACLAILWTAGWYVVAGKVEEAVAGWREREARSGRVYACASETVGGYPFGIHVHCADPKAAMSEMSPPLSLRADDLRVSARLWQPTVLTGALSGPLTVEGSGYADRFTGRWKDAQVTVHGQPQAPRRLDIALQEPTLMQADGAQERLLFQAGSFDLQGTMLEGSAQASPVVQVAARASNASAPALHPIAALPMDLDLVTVLRGLKDFGPKPWSERFRELAAAGGRIEITRARIQQGESVALAQGQLGLSANGRLDGELELTVAGLEKFLASLGLEDKLAKGAGDQMNAAFGALDRFAPGLGRFARKNAGPALAVGLAFIGRPTELEGRSAVVVPLRFSDGVVALGPLRLGETPPLY